MNMLQTWAANLPERHRLEEFYAWLLARNAEKRVLDIHIDQELDAYHGIDQQQLDKERRQIIDDHRQPSAT